MVKRIFFPINGGLGDVYKGYWSYLPYGKLGAFKKKYPDSIIKFIVCSHNPQSSKFYRYHPYIDEIEVYPAIRRDPGDKSPGELIADKYGEDYTWARSLHREFKALPYKEPLVYLKDQKEKRFVKNITSAGKYISLHPFAGGTVRNVPSLETYYKIACRLNKELGYNIVILGGSYTRTTERDTRETQEEFSYSGKGIIDLVGKTNSRTAAQIVRNGAGFIGTWSCFLCAILETDIRGITYIPANRPALLEGGTYKNLSKEMKPLFVDKETNLSLLRNDTIAWFEEKQ